MYKRINLSVQRFSSLVNSIGVLLYIAIVGTAAAQTNKQQVPIQIVSDTLLSSPVKHYNDLKTSTPNLNSPAETLQLALTQHLLGLHGELRVTLEQLEPMSVSQHPEWLVLYFFLVGTDASKNAQYEQSLQSLSYAKKLAEKNDLMRLWVLATQEQAFVEAIQERYEKAFLQLQEAYLRAQQFQGEFELALVEQTLGAVYSYTDNYEQANNYYQQALGRYQALSFPAHEAETQLGIATTLRHQLRWDEALAAYDKYKSAIEFQGSVGDAFYYHYGKGITLALSGRCAEAVTQIDAAVSANGPLDYLGELYKKQAMCAVQNGLINEAKNALASAKLIIDATPGLRDTLWQAELVLIESNIAEQEGNVQRALNLFREYHQVTTRLQSKKSSNTLLSLKSALESERKDAKIQQLQQESRLQSLEILNKATQQQRSLLILGCAALILMILSGIIYYQRRKTQYLYELSVHDPLTNLYNRRHAISVVEHWLEQHRNERQVFSIFIIDIDHFKEINDTFGHPVGDELLIAIANAASKIVRPSDVLARFGGEEFICVLPRISAVEAENIAERIRQKIATTRITLNDTITVNRTVSVGIAHVNHNDIDLNTVLARADSAMYEAKKAGRNRVAVS